LKQESDRYHTEGKVDMLHLTQRQPFNKNFRRRRFNTLKFFNFPYFSSSRLSSMTRAESHARRRIGN
jgi:hypothetical protein